MAAVSLSPAPKSETSRVAIAPVELVVRLVALCAGEPRLGVDRKHGIGQWDERPHRTRGGPRPPVGLLAGRQHAEDVDRDLVDRRQLFEQHCPEATARAAAQPGDDHRRIDFGVVDLIERAPDLREVVASDFNAEFRIASDTLPTILPTLVVDIFGTGHVRMDVADDDLSLVVDVGGVSERGGGRVEREDVAVGQRPVGF